MQRAVNRWRLTTKVGGGACLLAGRRFHTGCIVVHHKVQRTDGCNVPKGFCFHAAFEITLLTKGSRIKPPPLGPLRVKKKSRLEPFESNVIILTLMRWFLMRSHLLCIVLPLVNVLCLCPFSHSQNTFCRFEKQ